MSLPVLYTVAEVAAYASCSVSAIYAAINRGELRARRIGAKAVLRVSEPAILEWLGEPTESDPTPAHGIVRPAVTS